jgi:4-diphosphocytidyl-2-C-methyl-D-erythritol kinase
VITEFAPAKINLALHVTGQREDGYHLLHSLVAFTVVGDVLRFEPAETLRLAVTGPLAAGVPTGGDNLALKAAALFGDASAAITLEKHLPHAAGIGGGSADAAATLRGLARLLGRDLPRQDAILGLGADVPVCLLPKPQIMAGIGEVLSDPPSLPPLHAVLINPRVSVPTGSVFAGLAQKDNPPLDTPIWQDFGSFIAWLKRQRNDLEPPALALAPQIGACLDALRREDVALARMSGSGATCFGLVNSRADADRAAARIQAANPNWWVRASDILS